MTLDNTTPPPPALPDWLSPADADAVMAGQMSDPFAVFGPAHRGVPGRLVVFDPYAERLSAIGSAGGEADDASGRAPLWPLAPVAGRPGLFAGAIPAHAAYRLEGSGGREAWSFEDPYRFGPVMGPLDEHLISEGTHLRLWQVLGARVLEHEGVAGTCFAVWAPNARRVSVVGSFNAWDGRRHPMRPRGTTGVWELFLPAIGEGAHYGYEILAGDGTLLPIKADPVGFGAEHPPKTRSVVRDITGYGWRDGAWMTERAGRQAVSAPVSIYEVHLGSWRRRRAEGNRPISYREAAEELVGYAAEMGFTHIELLPISEHPFDGSWGYQPVGLYAPTIRHGPPHEFRDLIDAAHGAGLGVILDWVPGHFPTDPHGLARFDGTALYEHGDPKEGYHPDWNTFIYNFGRREVANFLSSNALYWLEEYHIDGLRVDAVASMLYRDYSRRAGEWVPNIHGGRENLEAIAFLQQTNVTVYGEAPYGIITIAEESTAFPGVSRPVDTGGLGFGYKWNMGWMNDTLAYFALDPVHRRFHHNRITFGLTYAFSENFVLPVSHDEVVHGKGTMISRMPGGEVEKFANLRAFYALMWAHPGKKLLFMGQEFAQWREWNHNDQLDWGCLADPRHAGMRRLVRDLNTTYRALPALHARDCDPGGFDWIEVAAADVSIFAWMRLGGPEDAPVVMIANLTPVERTGWVCGLPRPGHWREVMNSDAGLYGGANRGNLGGVEADGPASHGQPQSARLTLPPLSVIWLTPEAE